MKRSIDKWNRELRFIESVDPRNPGETFNHDPDCFARYCNMQANAALRDGLRVLSMDILQYRDAACPDFRSRVREGAECFQHLTLDDPHNAIFCPIRDEDSYTDTGK